MKPLEGRRRSTSPRGSTRSLTSVRRPHDAGGTTRPRPPVDQLNAFIACGLCNGYLVDATTVSHCLHPFCHSCLVKYMRRGSKTCPTCRDQFKTRTITKFRRDKTLQLLVYKMVPGLYRSELKRRQEFYSSSAQCESGMELSVYSPTRRRQSLERDRLMSGVYTGDECISVCLQHCDSAHQLAAVQTSPGGSCSTAHHRHATRSESGSKDQRYLLCPVAVTIGHLKKYIKLKFALDRQLTVELYIGTEAIDDSLSLVDVAYVYMRRKVSQVTFYYTVCTTAVARVIQPALTCASRSIPTETAATGKNSASTDARRRRSSTPRSVEPPNGQCSKSVTPPVELNNNNSNNDDDDDDVGSATSDVSLLIEVSVTHKDRDTTDLVETDDLVDGASHPVHDAVDVEMVDDIAVCCDDEAAAVVDGGGTEQDVMDAALIDGVDCSVTEQQLAASTDNALSLLIDENLSDVISLGFSVDDGSAGVPAGWLPTPPVSSLDGVVLTHGQTAAGQYAAGRRGASEVSEDTSSDIDVELRRIVANVTRKSNTINDEMNSVTSDDCSAAPDDVIMPCVSPSSDCLCAAAAASTAPHCSLVSTSLDYETPTTSVADSDKTTSLVSPLNACSALVTSCNTGCVTTSASDSYSSNTTSSCVNALSAAISAESAICATDSLTSCLGTPCHAGSGCTFASNVDCRSDDNSQRGSGQQTSSAAVNAVDVMSCTQRQTRTPSSTCDNWQPTGTVTTTSDPCVVTDNAADGLGSSTEQFQSQSATHQSTDTALSTDLPSWSQPVRENISSSAALMSVDSVRSLKETMGSSTSADKPSNSNCSTSASIQTSSGSGCGGSVSVTQHGRETAALSTGSKPCIQTVPAISCHNKSSKNSECSPTVDCVKLVTDSLQLQSRRVTSPACDASIPASEQRASVATQTNTDLLGRYFHRRNKPVTCFRGGTKQSRSSVGCAGLSAGLKERRLSSRMMSKSAAACTGLSTSISGNSAYHFHAPTSSSSSASTTSSSAVTGSAVIVAASGQHLAAPIIMPALGPFGGVNGKTTFLITVPANFTIPTSMGTVIGTAASTGSVAVSLGLSKPGLSVCQLMARPAVGPTNGSRLTAAVNSGGAVTPAGTTSLLARGQSLPLPTPLQLVVAAAGASGTAASTTHTLLGVTGTSQSKQPMVAVVTCTSVLTAAVGGAQTSTIALRQATSTAVTTSLVSQVMCAISDQRVQPVKDMDVSSSVLVSTSVTSSVPVALRQPVSRFVMLPPLSATMSPLSARLVRPVNSSISTSSGGVSASSLISARCCTGSSTTSPSVGARHATIASLPRVGMRRHTSGVCQPSLTTAIQPTAVNGLRPVGTSPASLPAVANCVRQDGGKSPVGGTTPTLVTKQPVHAEGAPASIIRAILERNLSSPLTYNLDDALTGQYVATAPTLSPNGGQVPVLGTVTDSCPCARTEPLSHVLTAGTMDCRRRASDTIESAVSTRSEAVCQLTPSVPHQSGVNKCVTMCSSEQQDTASVRKRVGPPSVSRPSTSRKRRRQTAVDTCSTDINAETVRDDSASCCATSACSMPPSTAFSLSHCRKNVSSNTSVNISRNAMSVSESRERQNQMTLTSPSTRSNAALQAVDSTWHAQTTASSHQPLTRPCSVALPKKVYAYLGSAGAARENAAAAALLSDLIVPPPRTPSPSVSQGNSNGLEGGGRATTEDGPMRHLRLMCSGLAACHSATAGGAAARQLRSHTSA